MNIDKILDKEHNKLSERIQNWTHKGSGWAIDSILHDEFVIQDIAPSKECSYFRLPKELKIVQGQD